MDVSVREDREVTVVALAGELDAASSPLVSESLEKLLATGRQRFVIDLVGVSVVDSSGLSTLVRFFKRVRSGGGRLRLVGLQRPVRRVFELTRLDRAFDIDGAVAEAVRAFGGAGGRARLRSRRPITIRGLTVRGALLGDQRPRKGG